MNKVKLLFLSIFTIVLMLGCQPQITAAPQQPVITPLLAGTQPTVTGNASTLQPILSSEAGGTVQLAWFYKPPEEKLFPTLAEQFDFFILTHRDEEEREALRTLGVTATIYQYLLFIQIMDPGSCTERPYGNQVAYLTGDFCELEQNHPDWFLRDQDGNLIRNDQTVYMDPGNEGYRQFWLERVQQMRSEFGWDGIFIDNVEASLTKLKRIGAHPANYRNDTEYQNTIESFLKFAYDNYFQPQAIPVTANIIELKDNEIWFRYMQYLDGAMVESFAVDYNNRYLLFNQWEAQVQLTVATQALGKTVILVAQGEEADQSRQEFALATYFLVNDGSAFFRYANSDNYDQVWLYDNYTLDLGSPLGPAYQIGITWQRDFEFGSVRVNPVTFTSEITPTK